MNQNKAQYDLDRQTADNRQRFQLYDPNIMILTNVITILLSQNIKIYFCFMMI